MSDASGITLYHKPDCVQCEATRRAMDARGLSYAMVDLTQDEDALVAATAAGHRSAPVVALDGMILWSGFRPDLIDRLAEAEGMS